jgi:filamentous hemagglutinin family protein
MKWYRAIATICLRSALLGIALWQSSPAIAQVSADGTLSTIVTGGSNVIVTGGTQVGSNVFHSFTEFSIPTNGSVWFDNAITIDNIISRVTGNSPSVIDGLIRANGSANVFLLNPNGITFGTNASLSIGGSFFASTASGLRFADGTVFRATDTGVSPLLTMSVPVGAQGITGLEATIVSNGRLTVPQNLTLVGGKVTLSGETQAGGEVVLQASDRLTIRDSSERPLLLTSGGTLLLSGEQQVDVFALSHPQSRLVSGGNLVFRSATPVIGDARYSVGGSFRVEQPDGRLGVLTSPNDPVIRSLGDVSFQAYEGASLHIYAAGQVSIPGYVWIQGADAVNGLVDTVTLTNGTVVAVDGQTRPTLDIRAGMDPQAVNSAGALPVGTIGDGNFFDDQPAPTTPTLTATPSSADIRIGRILFADAALNPLQGTLLLTNRFQPNTGVSGGAIVVDRVNAGTPTSSGGQFFLDSRSTITTGQLNASGGNGAGGVVGLVAVNGITTGNITTTSVLASGGDVLLTTRQGQISTGNITTTTTGNANSGNVTLAGQTIRLGSDSANPVVVDTQIAGTGRAGQVTLQGETVQLSNAVVTAGIAAGASGTGGAVQVTAQTVSLLAGSQVRSQVLGIGSGGTVTMTASTGLTIAGASGGNPSNPSGIVSTTQSATGQGGAIALNVGNLQLADGGVIQTSTTSAAPSGDVTISVQTATLTNGGTVQTSTSDSGDSGNITVAAQTQLSLQAGSTIASSSTQAVPTSGSSGTIRVTSPVITLNNSQIQTSTVGGGDAGMISLQSNDRTTVANNSLIRSLASDPNATGQGGALGITTSRLTINGSTLVTGTIGQGNAGDVTIQTSTLEITNGGTVQTSTSGIGNAGLLSLSSTNGITLTSRGQVQSLVEAGATGNGSPVQLQAGTIALSGGSQIQSRVDAAPGNGGDVTLQAGTLSLTDSILSTVNRGGQQGGQLTITTQGTTALTNSRVETVTESSGNAGANVAVSQGGDVVLRARSLQLGATSQIATRISTVGQAGSLDLATSEGISLVGSGTDTPSPLITSTTTGTAPGTGGAIRLEAPTLALTDGAVVSTATASPGDGGTLQVTTAALDLSNGGQLRTETTGSGDGGDVTIVSRDRLLLDTANTGILSTTTPNTTGSGGDITIASQDILVRNQAAIAVLAQSSGTGGDIRLQARTITLQNQATIATETTSGLGGDITIQLDDLIFLRNQSQISATSNVPGSGSNIRFQGGYIVGFPSENSNIIASTNGGTGGTIQINSQGVFGFVLRSTPSSFSNIITPSQLQLQGQAVISTPGDDPDKGLVELPDDVLDTSDQIVVGCPADRGNKFTIPGRGGLPPTPSEAINSLPTLLDWGDDSLAAQPPTLPTAPASPEDSPAASLQSTTQPSPRAADRWLRLADGPVVSLGQQSLPPWQLSASCPRSRQAGR